MATATTYFNAVNQVQSDLDTLADLSGDIGTAATVAENVLKLPGKLEDRLREKADLVDLPNSVVTLLGALPFGIGTAIKQLDNIANSVSGTIDAQADVLGALDTWDHADFSVLARVVQDGRIADGDTVRLL